MTIQCRLVIILLQEIHPRVKKGLMEYLDAGMLASLAFGEHHGLISRHDTRHYLDSIALLEIRRVHVEQKLPLSK